MHPDFARRINKDLNISISRVEETLRLLESGATVPFIARYRKDVTGNLDEARIGQIARRHRAYQELEERRTFILTRLGNKNAFDDDLQQRIASAGGKNELEDLYLPFRSKREARATLARERQLGPLADFIAAQTGTPVTLEETAAGFVSAERDVPTPQAAIQGARDILAERVQENAALRGWLRHFMWTDGIVRARTLDQSGRAPGKYAEYADFSEPVARIRSHRFLAIRRGVREKQLKLAIETDLKKGRGEARRSLDIRNDCPWRELLEEAADDGFDRLLEPSIQAETRALLRWRAESEVIGMFQENLRSLLLGAPAGQIPVLGITPGPGAGAHFAAVDAAGRLLETEAIFLTGPAQDPERAKRIVFETVGKHGIRGIAIGSGPGSRETEAFIRETLRDTHHEVFVIGVNGAGTAVWARSPEAGREFPDLDGPRRSAVSIARRLQDPLAELVRIEPDAIALGQYQHDVNQNRLRASLAAVASSAVNQVGVELNTASYALLRHVSGLGEATARAIVEYRGRNGAFRDRRQLLDVPGVDPGVFEQAAGFLRIANGPCPLDGTAIHPEAYAALERMAQSGGITAGELLGDRGRIDAIRFGDFAGQVGTHTLEDIRHELLRPGDDPRQRFRLPQFRDDVLDVADLREGMELEGRITSVANFGAFVDVGVHQDGLIHISELAHGYVADARRIVGIGDLVRVKVLGVSPDTHRIRLSRKAVLPAPRPRPAQRRKDPRKPAAPDGKADPGPEKKPGKPGTPRTRRPPGKATAPPRELSMEEKLRLLEEKFRGPDR